MRKTCDPISVLKNKILTSNLATKDEVKSVEKQVKHEVIQRFLLQSRNLRQCHQKNFTSSNFLL